MMQSGGSTPQRSQKLAQPAPCASWPVDLELTHVDWSPEATLIHFQAQYLTLCPLEYNILQGAIQNAPKTQAAVERGEFCLVEDAASARWFRGRVQSRHQDLFNVFLIDHGHVLSVNKSRLSSCSDDLLSLPPKIVNGFLANVLLLQTCSHAAVENYLLSLIGTKVSGHIQALLPDKVLLLEAPDINGDLVKHGFGRHMDTDTFLLLVALLTEGTLKQNMEPVPDLLIETPGRQEFFFKSPGLQRHRDIMSSYRPSLSCGTRVKVRVTAAVNTRLFHCQMADKKTDLWEMSKKLAAVCEYKTKGQWTQENVGSLCAVKGKDGKWYRGHRQGPLINSLFRVFFIDYGYFDFVKVENIQSLPPDVCSTPVMAFPCSLSCLSQQDEAVKAQQLSFLKAGLLGEVLDVEISFDEKEHLHTVTLIGSGDSHVEEAESLREPPQRKGDSHVEAETSTAHTGHLYIENTMEGALDKAMEAEDVRQDSVFVGYVEYAQNPNRFWIRTQKRNDEFEEMMTKLAKHFDQVKLEEDVLLNPVPGTMCCALYEKDMHFYRGVVTDTLKHGAEVYFIDFGNMEKVPRMLIKKMPEFAKTPAFAFCCTLNIVPSDEVWTCATLDIFRQMVSRKALLVHVVQKRKNKFMVELHEMGQKKGQSITNRLVSAMKVGSWNNTTHEPAVQTNRGPVTPASNGNPKQEKIIQNAPAPVRFNPLDINPGSEIAVRCSHIESSAEFWCQPQENVPVLEALMEKIQEYYSTNSAPLQTGALCCVARSSLDGRWHRAFITEKHRDRACVIFVDYGSTIQIQENNLQAIAPEFAKLERQAFRCTLSNLIESSDPSSAGNWSLDFVKKFVLNSTGCLRCQVVSKVRVKNKEPCNAVDLYDTQTQQSLISQLLEQGLARRVTFSTLRVSTVSPETFVYSSYDLSPGKEEQVYVTHVCNQWDVYCHLERNFDLIEELEQKVSQECEKMLQTSTGAVVTKLCLAKYLDGYWYRGLARPVQSEHHLSVFFVDYGNESIAEKTSVMFIPSDSAELLYTPMQAVRCCLASVSKEELYADIKEWLDSTILNKHVKVVINGKNEDGSLDVTMFDGDTNINEKAKELILSLKPKPKTDVSFEKRIKPMSRTNVCFKFPFKRKSPSSTDKGSRGGKEPHRKTRDHDHVTPQNRDKKMRLQNKNITKKGSASEKTTKDLGAASEQPQKHKQTRSQQPLYIPHKIIAAGLRAKCFISHINSVDNFFLHVSEDEPALLKLGEDLNSSALTSSLTTAKSFRVTESVLAVYEEDGALYRAVVRKIEESSGYTVEFVDYGNTTFVEERNIHQIPKEFLCQSRFSVPCCLSDSCAFESDASFADAVLDKPVMVDFVCQYENVWQVRVEALDGEVGLPAAPDPVVERFLEESSADLEQEETCHDPETKEMVTDTVQGQQLSPKTNTQPTKVKFKMVRHRRRPVTKTSWMKKNPKKSYQCPNKVKRLGADSSGHQEIKTKDRESGTILSVRSNGEFFVRLAKSSHLLDTLEKCIAYNLHRCEVTEDPKPGFRCLVQLKDEDTWQRAEVQHVAGDKCQVLLVDRGITEEVPSVSIRRQCGALKRIPDLAVPCRVNNLGFSQGGVETSSWSSRLEPIVGSEVNLEFVRLSEADHVWMVEIVVDRLFLICQRSESETHTMEQKVDTGPPQQLVWAPVHIGQVYSGSCIAVSTPFTFCVVLENSLHNLPIMLEEEVPPPVPDVHLVQGTSCLFKSDSTNGWCRAEIADASGTRLVLFLVDYGRCESIPRADGSRLKRLPEELLQVPKGTYPCSLRGVNPAGGNTQWSDGAATFFLQSLDHKKLQICFREFVSNSHWKVDILADGAYVAKKLVDAGHADYVDVMLGLRFQEITAPPPDLKCKPECDEEADACDGMSDFLSETSEEAEEEEEQEEEEGGAGALNTLSRSAPCSVM